MRKNLDGLVTGKASVNKKAFIPVHFCQRRKLCFRGTTLIGNVLPTYCPVTVVTVQACHLPPEGYQPDCSGVSLPLRHALFFSNQQLSECIVSVFIPFIAFLFNFINRIKKIYYCQTKSVTVISAASIACRSGSANPM